MCTLEKVRAAGERKLALAQTWMDSAQLIKIKRFNSTEIEAAIQRAPHVGAILISSQPEHSSTFWCETIFCIFNYTLQQPSNYQNQAHLHDWNIIIGVPKTQFCFGSCCNPFHPLLFASPKSFSGDGAYERVHED